MIKVEQTVLKAPNGNCLAACMASIFELSIDEVPQHPDIASWRSWLAERNLQFVRWPYGTEQSSIPRGYSILLAISPRSTEDYTTQHAVVCFDGEIVWDPHPHRDDGLGERVQWIVLAVLDPARTEPT